MFCDAKLFKSISHWAACCCFKWRLKKMGGRRGLLIAILWMENEVIGNESKLLTDLRFRLTALRMSTELGKGEVNSQWRIFVPASVLKLPSKRGAEQFLSQFTLEDLRECTASTQCDEMMMDCVDDGRHEINGLIRIFIFTHISMSARWIWNFSWDDDEKWRARKQKLNFASLERGICGGMKSELLTVKNNPASILFQYGW